MGARKENIISLFCKHCKIEMEKQDDVGVNSEILT